MDLKVAVQRSKAYILAAWLGCSFFPTQTKATVLGALVFPTSTHGPTANSKRIEAKVRDFESGQFDSTLIESHLVERMGMSGTDLWYAEFFTDDKCILYRDLGSIVEGLTWTETEANRFTVEKSKGKKLKSVAYIPYSKGQMIDLAQPNPQHQPTTKGLF